MCISPQRHAILRHLNRQKWSKHAVFCTFWLSNVHFATAACNFATSKQTKVVQTCGVLYILTFKCAFRHSFVQFFDIWTDKSAPKPSCFVYFHVRMCFSPQRHAIFRHLNRQKCSKAVMFCTFWLSNVLFATAACNFWFRLWALTSAPAALTGLLFDWPNRRIIEKTQHFKTSLTFGADVSSFFWLSRYCIFCRLTWRLYCGAMHLLFNCPYCRKFLFKLPSITPIIHMCPTNRCQLILRLSSKSVASFWDTRSDLLLLLVAWCWSPRDGSGERPSHMLTGRWCALGEVKMIDTGFLPGWISLNWHRCPRLQVSLWDA